MPEKSLPEWERLLAAAARLQHLVPGAVLVGGTAAAAHAHHRLSMDADHTVGDLRTRFDEILASLESVAGWKTARVRRPVLILGSLDGIETGVRQLIREAPLETERIQAGNDFVVVPTRAEMLRIKGVLILRRNATRDYLDFAAMARELGPDGTACALADFDSLYPQPNGQSALQQLLVQLSNPMPFDLDDTDLSDYKRLVPEWQDWAVVASFCSDIAVKVLASSGKR
ncbi:MAG: nucleotidyl transferase AbiEii/AbiGii toxin family protein [Kiritimatiellae bacterium]|nr:nucleotidyl transferase AbiEii/AbiGii toxin family protein [Kiritimatiellia bacterium]